MIQMNTCTLFSAIALSMALTLGMSACTSRTQHPPTFEQQELQRAKEQCQQEASDMVDGGAQNSENPLWSSYFEMCMHRLGVTDAQLKQMWY